MADVILLHHLKEHSVEISLQPVGHLHASPLHRYSTWSKSLPFLEWHEGAHFLASRRTLRHVFSANASDFPLDVPLNDLSLAPHWGVGGKCYPNPVFSS